MADQKLAKDLRAHGLKRSLARELSGLGRSGRRAGSKAETSALRTIRDLEAAIEDVRARVLRVDRRDLREKLRTVRPRSQR